MTLNKYAVKLILLAAEMVNEGDDDDMDEMFGVADFLLKTKGLDKSYFRPNALTAVLETDLNKEIVQIEYSAIVEVLKEAGFEWTRDWNPEFLYNVNDAPPFDSNLSLLASLYACWILPIPDRAASAFGYVVLESTEKD